MICCLNFRNQRTTPNVSLCKTMPGNGSFDPVYKLQVDDMLAYHQNSTGVSAVKCAPVSSPQSGELCLNHTFSSGGIQACCISNSLISFLPSGRRVAAQSEQASLLRRLRQLLAPSTSRETPCSGKEQPDQPPTPPHSLSSFTLDKQNTARYSRHILPVAITSMGASAPRTVWC